MKSHELLDAIGEAQDMYVLDAKASKKKHTSVWAKWVAVAACFCLILTGVLALLNPANTSQPDTAPFVLSAYAMGTDNNLYDVPMTVGESVPISIFEAGNGMTGFVFSSKTDDQKQTVSISIVSADFSSYIMSDSWKSTTSESVETIKGIDVEKTLSYIFVVPSKGEEPPYSLEMNIHDEASNTLVLLTLVIEQKNGNYTAEIEAIHDCEAVNDIDELLKPYQEVIDRLNEEYGYGLHIPEDRKISVYMAYKDMTPAEFEVQIRKELEVSTNDQHTEYDGSGSHFEYIDVPFP